MSKLVFVVVLMFVF